MEPFYFQEKSGQKVANSIYLLCPYSRRAKQQLANLLFLLSPLYSSQGLLGKQGEEICGQEEEHTQAGTI